MIHIKLLFVFIRNIYTLQTHCPVSELQYVILLLPFDFYTILCIC